MLTYRDLTTPQRRALDRFARANDFAAPMSRWPELGAADVTALLARGMLERAGRDGQGEELFRLSDQGTRVHDEMWRDGKVPAHPVAQPYDPSLE